MRITVLPTAEALPPAGHDWSRQIAVVIDVLRATSSMSAALHNGAAGIYMAADPDAAKALAGALPGGALLGGERGAKLIPGFDLGNSPRDYTRQRVEGRNIVMTTTNGTRAMQAASGAATLYAMSFRNLPTVLHAILGAIGARQGGPDQELTIVCAGTHDQVSIDDAGCAGMLLVELATAGVPVEANDFGHMCRLLYLAHQANLEGLLRTSKHGQLLLGMDLGPDLALCATVGDLDVLPRWDGSKLVAD